MPTPDTIQDATFAIVGTMTRHANTTELGAQLEALGASVTYALTGGTDYLVAGQRCGYQIERAEVARVPVIDEDLVGELLGEELDWGAFNDVIAAREESAPAADANEVVERLRPLINGDETPRWSAIVGAFEGADADAARVAVDYVAHWLDAFPLDFSGYNSLGQYAGAMSRYLPKSWKPEVLAGEDSPKLEMIRLVSVCYDRLGNAALCKMFECPSLGGVRMLDVGGNKPGSSFFKKLSTSGQFERLNILKAQNRFKASQMKALLKNLNLPNLRWLDIESSVDQDALDLFTEALPEMGLRYLSMRGGRCTFRENHLRGLFSPATLEHMRGVDLCIFRVDGPALLAVLDEAGELEEGQEPVRVNMTANRDVTETHADLQAAIIARTTPTSRVQPYFESDYEFERSFYDCID